jgi:phage portal protein BeeE
MILDGGMELDSISNVNFKELDFEVSIDAAETQILKALGIPPILLDSGNNANIRPNHRLYYLETILPIAEKINCALERYFGYEISNDISGIPALQPELRDAAAYYTTLVNSGIITPNEARLDLNYTEVEGYDDIRVPQNIAGSAVDSSQGGRPNATEEN